MAGKTLDLKSFKIPLGKLSPLETFRTRQGDVLSYRIYPAWSDNLIVLYHGVGSDSRYMCVLATAMAQAGLGTVVTPDLRGHGASLKAADPHSQHQFEIDLEELIIHIKMTRAVSRVILAGHSLGGGFVLRVAVSDIRRQFAQFLAISPYLPPGLHVFHDDFGGWISPDGNGGFKVNLPVEFVSGQEKLTYSAAYLAAVTPSDKIMADIQKLHPPVHVVVGEQDELIIPQRQEQLFTEAGANIRVVQGLNHLTIVSKPDVWLQQISL
ncbi:alpha/beta hydrolase [Bdellovibrio bacteriovorus]|uniref:Lysophospholipase n=1 Tax=Bdellovibrio bacteriovorus TaxID=959 RepID=A0A1Z3N9N9_BDEBC|nr:alpha/beta hydrolase [Bdellovibrio bacteriovorus]ASD64179.1 lysophospholipase [Bdellovibrio bacteriovorus]